MNASHDQPTPPLAAPTATPRMGRRRAVAVLAAAGAGALHGCRWLEPDEPDTSGFWSRSFVASDGSTLALAPLRGRPLLVNFWATWCPPCIEELPLLSSFYNENKANGWQLLGLAVDRVEPVTRFLAKTPVSFPMALAGLDGVELTRELGNAAGGLPFSVLFDASGQLRARKLGQLREHDLAAWRKQWSVA
ncbi:MAG: TlpA disulfide reductase family protein [Pseudomonadota bacterium]|nr:TlpA disulfide reductase family protein [Pseudomonadota bacterium]